MSQNREDELTRLAIFEALASTAESTPEYLKHSAAARTLRARLEPISEGEAQSIEDERRNRIIHYDGGEKSL